MILEIFALSCFVSAFGLLIILSVIDLKIGLLPNVYNAGLALSGGLFHVLTSFLWLGIEHILLGALIGGGILFGIRLVANKVYKQDTLGLGDVKLLAAAGVWLGPHSILLAITIGAFAGILHSVFILIIQKVRAEDTGKLSHFSIPAGPGFCFGILVAGIYHYLPFMKGVF